MKEFFIKEPLLIKIMNIFAIILILGGSIAFGVLISTDNLVNSYLSESFFLSFLLLILAYLLSITIHELSHFISFKLSKIRVRLISIFLFTWISKQDKWEFKFIYNPLVGIGGLVIPDIHPIKNAKEFYQIQRNLSNAIITAPFVSIVVGIINFVSILLYYFFFNTLNHLLFLFMFFMIVISFLLFTSSLISSKTIAGDFPAYLLYRYKKDFCIIQLFQYAIFASNYKKVINESSYVNENIEEIINNSLNENKYDKIIISVLDNLLHLYLVKIYINPSEKMHEHWKLFFHNPEIIMNEGSDENYKIFWYHLIYYFYLNGKEEEAIRQYNIHHNKKFANHFCNEYYRKLSEHIFKINNNSKWLSDKHNIKSSSTSTVLLQLFESYYELESELQKLKS